MGIKVDISSGSKELITKLSLPSNINLLGELHSLKDDSIDRDTLVCWLKRDLPHTKKTRLLLESLRVSLMKDLHESFLTPDKRHLHKKKKPTHWSGKFQLAILAIAGTVLAICEGFDGVSSIMGLFSSLPAALVLSIGFVSSALSVSVFFGFDLVEISKNLGVSFGRTRQLLDVFMAQVEQIDAITKEIDDRYSETTNPIMMQLFQRMIEMLRIRYNYLDEVRRTYTSALLSPYLRGAKLIMAAIAGGLFFCGGFFAGQSLAVLVATLFVATVSVTFWPVLMASSIAGLAALCIYWFVQRPGLTNLVGRWMGLDRDKIDIFAGEEIVASRKEELEKLSNSVDLVSGMRKQISKLAVFDKTTNQKFISRELSKLPGTSTRGTFFRLTRSSSLNDLRESEQNESDVNFSIA